MKQNADKAVQKKFTLKNPQKKNLMFNQSSKDQINIKQNKMGSILTGSTRELENNKGSKMEKKKIKP